MRAMFYADGDGIPVEEVDALLRPLGEVVDAMQLDTGLVIQNLKQVGGRVGWEGGCLFVCWHATPRPLSASRALLACVRAFVCLGIQLSPQPVTILCPGPCSRRRSWAGASPRRAAPPPPWTQRQVE